MSQTFAHEGRRVDFDLWAFPRMDFTLDFDLIASYAITGSWKYIPKELLDPLTRQLIEQDLHDEDKSWSGVVVGATLVVVVNVVGMALVGAGAVLKAPGLVRAGTFLLAIPDPVVYTVGYVLGEFFFGDD